MADLKRQAAGQDSTQRFKENWVAEQNSHPRLIAILVITLGSVFLAHAYSNPTFVIIAVLALVSYLYLSSVLEGRNETLDLLLFQGDEIENDKRYWRNTLIECYIENGIIDDETRIGQVYVEVSNTYPLTFECQLTQQGRRLVDIQERLEKMCPVFNAARCSTAKVDNTTFTTTYYASDIYADQDAVISWGDYVDD